MLWSIQVIIATVGGFQGLEGVLAPVIFCSQLAIYMDTRIYKSILHHVHPKILAPIQLMRKSQTLILV